MPNVNTKFTDNHLKIFYGNLLTHYQECEKRKLKLDINGIHAEMFQAVRYAIESPHGSFYYLEPAEKNKVYASFEAIFKALPIYSGMRASDRNRFKPDYNELRKVIIINHYNGYRYNDSLLVDWMILSSMTNNCRYHHSFRVGGHVHSHPGSSASNIHVKDNNSDSIAKLIAGLVIIALAAFALVLATIALYYMLNEFLEGVERFWYNEGWLKAALMLATSIAFGSVSTVLTMTFAAGPLISLAMWAGFNPVGIVILGAVCLTVVGAGLGCYAMSLLYDKIDAPRNQDSMDAADPCRFRLTDSEETNLVSKGLDSIKVKCAMVALRAEMSKDLKSETASPSFLSRHFGDGQKVQGLLEKVRQLRQGNLTTVQVGDFTFNCSVASQPPAYDDADELTFDEPAHAAVRQPVGSSAPLATTTEEVEGSSTEGVQPALASAPPAYSAMG